MRKCLTDEGSGIGGVRQRKGLTKKGSGRGRVRQSSERSYRRRVRQGRVR